MPSFPIRGPQLTHPGRNYHHILSTFALASLQASPASRYRRSHRGRSPRAFSDGTHSRLHQDNLPGRIDADSDPCRQPRFSVVPLPGRSLVQNWRIALSVGALGMVLPFGLGAAVAYGLYHQFRTESGLVPISFGTYLLFIGVAMAITVSSNEIRPVFQS